MSISKMNREICIARNNYQEARKILVDKLRGLASDLNNEACRIGGDNEAMPPQFGIVQGSGPDIDRLCAVIRERLDHLESLIGLSEE